MGKPTPIPTVSTWLIWFIFAVVATTLFGIRAYLAPDVPVNAWTAALYYPAGVLIGFTIHRAYIAEEGR